MGGAEIVAYALQIYPSPARVYKDGWILLRASLHSHVQANTTALQRFAALGCETRRAPAPATRRRRMRHTTHEMIMFDMGNKP